MTVHFSYDKGQVLQALRYHFLSKPEIRIMIVVVNAFALMALGLYIARLVTPTAFIISSILWIVLMISFWFIMPWAVYKRAITFKESFSMTFSSYGFSLEHKKGGRNWDWSALTHFIESPHFFHLYFDARSFILVPKSAFKPPQEILDIRALLKKSVQKL